MGRENMVARHAGCGEIGGAAKLWKSLEVPPMSAKLWKNLKVPADARRWSSQRVAGHAGRRRAAYIAKAGFRLRSSESFIASPAG